jgi:uncharacterized protein YciI
MKNILLLTALFFASLIQAQNSNYDAELAQKLKADEYGMKKYVMVLLKNGPVKSLPTKQQDSIFGGHMKNIQRLADEKKLMVAGPFERNDFKYRGVFIFDSGSIEETKKLVATDPAIIAKLLDADYLVWYGSAAIMQVNETHGKISKKSH